jgi:WD40 repeat protein
MLFVGYEGGLVRVWDKIDGKLLQTFSAAEKRVTCLEVSPNGSTFASADWDSEIRIWA